MTKSRWKSLIWAQLKALGTTDEAYASVVETLAELLEKRDQVGRTYKDYGSCPVIEYTNKAGATNLTKNPLLVMWDELNKSALAYWRELGLTPGSYRKMSGEGPNRERTGGLADALKSLETE